MDVLSYLRWVNSQTNALLRSNAEVVKAHGYSALCGIPPHPDRPKTWDNFLALHHAVMSTPAHGRVLDAGGCRDSVFLKGLRSKGFDNLVNMNLDEPTPETKDGVTWRRGDITDFAGPDESYSFVACLSVIEHGVDVHKFLVEMSRAIQHGGHLFISTDYWPDPIDAKGQYAFGAPVRVFSKYDLYDMRYIAQKVGFAPAGPPWCIGDSDKGERVVNWLGMDYTFVNLLFRRV